VTRIAILTFDGFNQIDSFGAPNIRNRMSRGAWKAGLRRKTHAGAPLDGEVFHQVQVRLLRARASRLAPRLRQHVSVGGAAV